MGLARWQGGTIIDDVGQRNLTNVERQMKQAIEALDPPPKWKATLTEDQRGIYQAIKALASPPEKK